MDTKRRKEEQKGWMDGWKEKLAEFRTIWANTGVMQCSSEEV